MSLLTLNHTTEAKWNSTLPCIFFFRFTQDMSQITYLLMMQNEQDMFFFFLKGFYWIEFNFHLFQRYRFSMLFPVEGNTLKFTGWKTCTCHSLPATSYRSILYYCAMFSAIKIMALICLPFPSGRLLVSPVVDVQPERAGPDLLCHPHRLKHSLHRLLPASAAGAASRLV